MKECYIDMHCHILPGVDDGAKDLAETKKMLEIAYAEGIRCIIATPHHHPHRGKAPAEKLRERAKLVREAAHEIDERFRVYLGTEVYFGQDVADKLKEGKILSMNRREYVLVEFPPSQTYSYIGQGIQQLQFAGYEVILAHVERYHCIAEDVELAEELYDMGVNLQVNADSITGGSGRKIRKFIRKKGASCSFEKMYLATVEAYLEKGDRALALLKESEYPLLRQKAMEEGCVCHGEYNQHNVLMVRKKTAVTSFEHWGFDIQMADLYRFMRKILEKYNWDVRFGKEMLKAYHEIKPVSKEEWINLKIRFSYPEKYWKLANYYYTHRKTWISVKNTEKLQNLIRQREAWKRYCASFFF